MGKDQDHVHLNLSHLDKDIIESRLPGITDAARLFANVDVTKILLFRFLFILTSTG